MKKLTTIFFCVFLVSLSCQHEEGLDSGKGYVTFSATQEDLSGGRIASDIGPVSAVVSIQDRQGNFLYENHKLPLLEFGQSFVSENLRLNAGTFKLTAFVILNSEDKIIYASPVGNSVKAHDVDSPLPLEFTVSNENTTRMVPEVIEVTNQDTPEIFGYASFGFEIIGMDKIIPVKVNMKFMVGDILYENIEGSVDVKGFDAGDKEVWSASFPFRGPEENVFPVKKGSHHYTISMEKWGQRDSQTISAEQLWDGRANGPLPVTYVLAGRAPAKKIAYYVEYLEETHHDFVQKNRVEYEYNAFGKVERTSMYASTGASPFELTQYSLFTWSEDVLTKLVSYNPDNSVITTDTYEYGSPDALVKITEQNSVTGVMSLGYTDDNGKLVATYRYSNGAGFEYEFLTAWKNMVSDKTTRGGELCNVGVYTFDRNINPFKHLGYIDFVLRNYSINNTLTQDNSYFHCSFPELIPQSYDYEYDQDGYPTVKTTHYKGGNFVSRTWYFYQ